MFKNLKWLRLVPDAPGKGGTKSGFHSFQGQPVNETRVVTGFHVYRGRWRMDYASQAVPAITADTAIRSLALHAYTYPSLTDPTAAPSTTLLGHHFSATNSRYWEFTNGGVLRDSHSLSAIAATFLNIGGRCFIADGAREGMILDDRTPAIHAQANQNLGIATPTQPLGVNYVENLAAAGTAYIHDASPWVNHPNPRSRIGTVLSTDYVAVTQIDGWAAIYAGAGPMAGAQPVADAVSSDSTPFTATGTISINPAVDPDKVTLAGWVWPANNQYAGLAINFNGYSFVILNTGPAAGGARNVNGGIEVLTNVEALLLGEYDGPAIAAPGIAYTITGCQFEMPANADLQTIDTAAGTIGYSQSTASELVQVHVSALQDAGVGLYRNLGNISLGPESPDGAPTGNVQTITDGVMADARPKLTSASAPFVEGDVGVSIAVEHAGVGSTTLVTTIKTFIDASNVRLTNSNTSGGALAGAKAVWGTEPVITDAAMAAGSAVLTSASNPFVAGDVGQPIVVEVHTAAGAFVDDFLITTIQTYTNPGQVTLADANPDGANAIAGGMAWWRAVGVDVHEGPTYAYAWYDPETGHMSNISPTFQIPRPRHIFSYADFANLTPVFQIDPGSISYPSGIDATRFSHIMFFRTLSGPGNSTLYPIGSLKPYVGKVHPGAASTRGSWNPSAYHGWMGLPNNYTAAPPLVAAPQYWYDFSFDEDLILTGGFRAPQYTNEKPMALLRGGVTQPAKIAHQAYWDRRLWAVSTQEPDKVMFSCDEAQCPLGVPVESFPPTNFLRIPSVDGQVKGMRTVGDMLLITTQRWAYTIAGNNESNYRLLRISTRMGGVGTYQMDEMTSDVEGQPAIVYFLGRDKIVYEWIPGGQVRAISDPVQDILNGRISTRETYEGSRIHCVSAWARRLVIVAPNAVLPSGPMLAFDVEKRVWTSWTADYAGTIATVQPTAFTTIYGADTPVNELYAIRIPGFTQVSAFSWIRDDGAVQPHFAGREIATFPIDFDGKKTRKQIVMVNAHITGNGTWTLQLLCNESLTLGGTANMIPYSDSAYSIYGPVPSPVDSTNAKDLVVMTAAFGYDAVNDVSHPIVGYRFLASLGTTSTLAPTEIWAIDIGYVDWEEPGEGDP